MFLFYAFFVSIIFSLLGIIIGLWSKSFEQLNVLNTFVIMPLSFLGGVFNSITMFPEKIQFFVKLNPIFYFIDGIRYSMIGISESNLLFGVFLILSLCVVLFLLVIHLFRSGYRLRT